MPQAPVDLDAHRKALRDAARSRAQADEMKALATAHLRLWCVRARRAGMPIAEIAREAQLSRQAVYDLIGERSKRAG
jgi:DNA-binding phage protein